MLKTYTVAREHIGDRHYAEGDTREAQDQDVVALVANGVLVEAPEAPLSDEDFAKMDAPLKNKAEPPLDDKAPPAPASEPK
jgi:hypothetical protein